MYRKIIQNNPRIDFYLLNDGKKLEWNLPTNCTVIEMPRRKKIKFITKGSRFSTSRQVSDDTPMSSTDYSAFELSVRIADAIEGYQFDYVDVPEYVPVGSFLRSELTRRKINFGKIIHFFHGSLSITLKIQRNEELKDLEVLEEKQRLSADFAFALNDWYPKLLNYPSSRTYLIDPLQFLDKSNTSEYSSGEAQEKSRIVAFGRMERRKGFDLAIEISRQLRSKIEKLYIYGPLNANPGLFNELKLFAHNRNMDVSFLECTKSTTVYDSLSNRDILIVVSRFESFNLVALEALASGKLVAISKQCGIYHFLKSNHPKVYFIELDAEKIGESANTIASLLDCFENLSERLDENRKILAPRISDDYFRTLEKLGKKNISNFLMQNFSTPHFARIYNFINGLIPSSVRHFKSALKLRVFIQNLRKFNFRNLFTWIFRKYSQSDKGLYLVLAGLLVQSKFLLRRDSHPVPLSILDKPFVFFEIANNENTSDQVALTYALRVYRYAGYSANIIEPYLILGSLYQLNRNIEAEVVEKIGSGSPTQVFDYLNHRRTNLKSIHKSNFFVSKKVLDRNNNTPKISIIVSSYNAASKLETFLDRLSSVPELIRGEAEVFLVDANSPTPDLEVAAEISRRLGIRFRGIRVDTRISIQEAWNIAIESTASNYLMFLGVDETIFSDTVSILTRKFEAEPTLDWVMGNSVIANMSMQGDLVEDVMCYRRDGATIAHPFLETCYVSYVGGMYKRNIHLMHGFYDASFKGAGDTEFKSRVLPFINVGYVPDTLGEFLNYPEDRTTASSAIEIEDVRAWYIFRTTGGLLYQSQLLGETFLRDILKWSSGYRKSYCNHISIDLSMAMAAFEALSHLGLLNEEDASRKVLLTEILTLQTKIFFKVNYFFNFRRTLRLIALLKLLRDYLEKPNWSLKQVFNQYRHDNLFEQHHWFW